MSSFVVDLGGFSAQIYNKNTYPVFTLTRILRNSYKYYHSNGTIGDGVIMIKYLRLIGCREGWEA
jgi:hypothetical protein